MKGGWDGCIYMIDLVNSDKYSKKQLVSMKVSRKTT